jgi:3-oxoacyl-[acyl-carrier-protein] synthase-1
MHVESIKRVVVTGMGTVSCMGNGKHAVLRALEEGRSGLDFVDEMRDYGFRVPIAGLVRDLDTSAIDRQSLRTMSEAAKFAVVAADEALEDAGITREHLRGPRAGIVVGTGAGGFDEVAAAETSLSKHGNPRRLGAAGPPKILGSTAAIHLAARWGITGRTYSVSSACCTGTDCIGVGYELIRDGVLDLCICGASEEIGWSLVGFYAAAFRTPADVESLLASYSGAGEACRPYDRNRLGMMIASEGAGVVILESEAHARARGAACYAEVIGYGSTNDGSQVVAPIGEGLTRAVRQALRAAEASGAASIDYVNPHGAGTAVGDAVEIGVIRELFGDPTPLVSATKPLNGHSQGAAGVHETIHVLLMMQHGFVAPTPNLEDLDPKCEGVRHVRRRQKLTMNTALSFNTGLGGSNAALVFRRVDG